jgi:cathepsin A (carboxypeptidase C)/serine carboxypeptidase-like clade 2
MHFSALLCLTCVAWALAWAPTAAASASLPYSARALQDKIDALPGLPTPPPAFQMFSGYVDVSPLKDGSRSMFYWFVESQSDPATDPVLLWTNGGPGCSGLGGFLTEQGPFRPTANGTALTENPHAWNKIANMVFIEQPVGVGFSTTTEAKIAYGDAQAAADNHRFVVGFFERFSNLAKQDFYITSESYGGHYMPTLALSLLEGNLGAVPQFRGVAVGNPLTYMPYRNYGMYGTAYGHQILPKPLFDEYTAANCKDTWPTPSACNPITAKMDDILGGFDPYALDFPVCDQESLSGAHERHLMRENVRKAEAQHHSGSGYFPKIYEPCSQAWAAAYLDRDDVRAAIHVAASVPKQWSLCSNAINQGYNMTDVNLPMMPVWLDVLGKARDDFKIMVYSGDDDSVCATLGTQQWIWDLKLKESTTWAPWKFVDAQDDGQTAGFVTKFEGGMSFATVHGAGHMVPQTRPAQSLQLMAAFTSEDWRKNE